MLEERASVDDMLSEAMRRVTELAAEHFAKEAGAKRKAWISPVTWGLVAVRHRCLNKQLGARSRRRHALLRAAFSALRGRAVQAMFAVRDAWWVEAGALRRTALLRSAFACC